MHPHHRIECLRMSLPQASLTGLALRIALLCAFACSLVVAVPAHGAGTSGKTTAKPSPMMEDREEGRMQMTPEERAQRVETRIKTLHDKLGITSAQEAKWNDVAQTMRDNEAAVSSLIQSRRQNMQNMSAIDDLRSYQAIAQAHADGMNRLIASFQSLYDDMPDDQKKVADQVFGQFEGHRGGAMMRKGSGTRKQ